MDNVMAPQAITRNAAHEYFFEGVKYPGVTDIIDTPLGAGFHTASMYGAKQAAETVADLLEKDGALQSMYATLGREGFIKGIAGSAVKRRDEAAQRGTDIHGYAEKVAKGEPFAAPAPLRKRVEDYAAWWEASGWTLRLAEGMIVTPRTDDQPYGWGGTFDLLAFDRDGRTVLADVKSGNLYHKAVIQVAGYSMGRYVQFTDGKVYPMPRVDRHVIIHVTEDGVREVEINIGMAERAAFLDCLDLWHWNQSMKGKRL